MDHAGDQAALDACLRAADLLCREFLDGGKRVVPAGSEEMNESVINVLCLLFRRTGDDRYLNLALKICDEFAATNPEGKPLAGDYLNGALAGKEFFQLPKPRWESLHPILGLAELYSG